MFCRRAVLCLPLFFILFYLQQQDVSSCTFVRSSLGTIIFRLVTLIEYSVARDEGFVMVKLVPVPTVSPGSNTVVTHDEVSIIYHLIRTSAIQRGIPTT